MKIDINRLAEHFARTSFQVEAVYRCVRAPGSKCLDHTQPFPGFVFPLGGKAEFIFNGTSYILAPGNVVHGGAGMELERSVIGNTKWEYLLVLYRVCGLEPAGLSLASSHFEVQTGPSARLTDLLNRLMQVSSQPGGVASFHTETLFYNVLDEMFVCARNQTNGGAQILFEQATEYIHEFYMEPLTLTRLAEQNNVSSNRLVYVFRKYASMGPGDYILQYRLNRAKELLPVSKVPLRELAQSVGFSDPYHFSKLFKKHCGVSPSEYRKKFLNNTC